ncbi:MAG: AMP-binding protein, partial [Nannocystaceae bacterium]|nr:AMP-binding protein [Nannocystaceae bacterium]
SMEVSIIPISDDPIRAWSDVTPVPSGEIGEIVVKGPVVTPGYYRREDATALAKIPDGNTVRHRMGDVGMLDEQGRLWMCGRKAHRVQTAQGPMFTVPCEAIFNTLPEVRRSALVPLGDAGQARPAICIELTQGAQWSDVEPKVRALATKHDKTQGIETFLHHEGSFPVDVRHNSKIFREKLATWAEAR